MDTDKKAKPKNSRGKHAAGAHAEKGRHVSDGVVSKEDDSGKGNETGEFAVFPEQVSAFANQPAPLAPEPASQRGGKALKVVAIVLGSILALIVAVYIVGSIFFMGRFFPHTMMGDFDVSLKTAAEAQAILSEGLDDYSLTVKGEGLSFTLSAKDAGLSLDDEAILGKALGDINPWMWPFELQRSHDETDKLAATYHDSGLGEVVSAEVARFNETATQPENATVGYDESIGAYKVLSETPGTALDPEAVLQEVDKAIVSMEPIATVTEAHRLKPPVLSTDAALQKARDAANMMITADLELVMGPSVAAEVGPDQISSWIEFDEERTATLNEELLTAWVDDLAASTNTVGTTRTYTRPDGKVITVSGGSYGWAVDRDALLGLVKEGVAAGQKGQIEVPVSQSAAQYVGAGERDWGNSYLDIDLAEQVARYYDDTGATLWESPLVSGKPDGVHDTSVGVYVLNSKASPSKLVGWENGKKIYETDVSYWMPFVGNVIGLHDAPWQAAFGGTRYADGFGSHGCVNLPYDKAQQLYGMISPGVPVISHW